MSTYGGSRYSENISYEQHFALNWNQKCDFQGCNGSNNWQQIVGRLHSHTNIEMTNGI